MISDERIAIAIEYIKCGFSNRFIAEHTGISRSIISEIRRGRRKEGAAKKRVDYARRSNLKPGDYESIAREARELLVKNRRESQKVL